MISFIIPTLNEAKVLASTLASLRELKVVEYEIIVSDGGSTDQTLAIAEQYADRVVEQSNDHRQNIAGGKNAGAAVARGEQYIFIDADVQFERINLWFPRLLNMFQTNPQLGGLIPWLKVFPRHQTLADRVIFTLVNWLFYASNNWLGAGLGSGECQIIRADCFNQLGGFNEQLTVTEDHDMFARLARIAPTRAEPSLVVFHTSRRAHAIGWPRLLMLWLTNFISYKISNRSFSKEWTVIR